MKFDQKTYDSLFDKIENDMREIGYGDMTVNKKMKDLNKIFYDILLKLKKNEYDDNNVFELNKNLIVKYFKILNDKKIGKYEEFSQYFVKFYYFCFELPNNNMIKNTINFKH